MDRVLAPGSADRIFGAVLSLPSSSSLLAADRDRVVEGLARALAPLS